MLNAYVRFASKHGLSMFQPERGFWAVLNDTESQSIHSLFFIGLRRKAMIAIDHCTTEIGPVVPGDNGDSRRH